MRLVTSDVDGVYGEVILDDERRIQVLFTDNSGDKGDGVSIERGGSSSFAFFVFVPTDVYDTLVEIHSLDIFNAALIRVCGLLEPGL